MATLTTRIQASTGTLIQFPKNWDAIRGRIDAIKFTPGHDFPGDGKVSPNFTRRAPEWDPKHPLVKNMTALGAYFHDDPLDPMYFVGTETVVVERPDPKNKDKRRKMRQEVAVWKGRTWVYLKETSGINAPRAWVRTAQRPDHKVVAEEEDGEVIPPTNT